MQTTEYLSRLREFAELLRPDAERMDSDAECLALWYSRLQQQGLNIGASHLLPLQGHEFCDALKGLSCISGAFAFVFLQQFVANAHLTETNTPLFPKVGVAFGHLRRVEGPSPQWREGIATGWVPWLTGANVFDRVLGMRDSEGRELLAFVETENRTAFQHSDPMPLLACKGTHTVSVRVESLPVPESAIFAVRKAGTQARGDANGVLFQTPLLMGCIEGAWEIISESKRLSIAGKKRCTEGKNTLFQRIFDAFTTNNAHLGRTLRAETGDFAVRLARLAMMATGGSSLLEGHRAQRLYREAMIFNLMAQTDTIVEDAFESVFPP